MATSVSDQLIICAVCDQSGSIQPHVKAYITGINEFIQSQRANSEEHGLNVLFNCLMFNSTTKWVSCKECDSKTSDTTVPPMPLYPPSFLTASRAGVPTPAVRTTPVFKKIHDFSLFDESTYRVAGDTALYDAIGQAIEAVDQEIDKLKGPAKVIIMIQTDGYENASRTYTQSTVKKLITDRTAAGWQFTYIAADEAAFGPSAAIGIDPKATISFNAAASSTTVPAMMRTVSDALTRSVVGGGAVAYTAAERRVVSEPCPRAGGLPVPSGPLTRQLAVGVSADVDNLSVRGDTSGVVRTPTTQSAYV